MLQDSAGITDPTTAITDVIDPKRGAILVRFSTRLKVGLTASGIAAVAITGFLGWSRQVYGPGFGNLVLSILDFLFGQPWVMFVWLCALILTLEAAVLRHPSLDRQKRALAMGTIVSMILGSAFYLLYLKGKIRPPCTPQPASSSFTLDKCPPIPVPDLSGLLTSPWTYIVANTVILLALAVQALLRWRRARAQASVASNGSEAGQSAQPSPEELSSTQDMIAGDLTTRAFIVLLLALIFRFDVIGWFTSVALPVQLFGQLFLVDLTIFFLGLVVGLFLVGLDVNEAGLVAMDDEDGAESAHHLSLFEVGQEMAMTLIDILLSPVRRPQTAVGRRIGASVRVSMGTLLWPLLIFVGVAGAGWLAIIIKHYLHDSATTINDQVRSFLQQPDIGTVGAYLVEQLRDYLLPGVGAGALAVFGTTMAMAALLARGRVASNSLQLLARLGFILLNTFCIFSCVLWGLNQLLLLLVVPGYYTSTGTPTAIPARLQPFNPGIPTFISLAVLVGFGITSLVHRPPRRRRKQEVTQPHAVVGATAERQRAREAL